jgi:ABC-type uncharacterized transport system ATPase subunit
VSSLSASNSSSNSIVVQDVSVTYRTSFEQRPTLRSMVRRMGRGERVIREIEAVKNVSFEVPTGTVLLRTSARSWRAARATSRATPMT